SSGLWPFSTLGWPDDTADLREFYPTSVLVTGYDILFFWVVRMMMFGLYAMKDQAPDNVPFRTVALHGLVRDAYGKKMSKSRGNTVDPLDWIDRFGADALRFTLARGSNPGSDEAISEDWVVGSRNFCNKLWNATRFALLNGAITSSSGMDAAATPTVSTIASTAVGTIAFTTASPDKSDISEMSLSVPDRWILSRLSSVRAEVDGLLEQFEFGKACEALYHFAWDELCDWYVELAKVPLSSPVGTDQPASGDERAAETTRRVLGFVLDRTLRLLHPVMPFVTDELWTALTGKDSVMMAAWPTFSFTDREAEREIASVMRLVTEIRRFRSDQGLRPGQAVRAHLAGIGGTPLAGHEDRIRALLRLDPPGDDFAASAALSAEGVTVELNLAGTVDVEAERKRLEKDLAAARKEAQQTSAKLANSSFTAKAPAEVVEKTRQRLAAAEADLARLEGRLAALS
ncbi:MAG TPA: class I tRNA ligase family protein, partial [Trebonia sp.]